MSVGILGIFAVHSDSFPPGGTASHYNLSYQRPSRTRRFEAPPAQCPCCQGTMEPIEPPWQAIKEWIPDDDPDLNWFNQERDPTGAEAEHDPFDQSPAWQPVEVRLGDGRILVLDDS